MLNNILEVVKDAVQNTISGNTDISEDQKGQVVDTATSAITNGLASNLGNLTNLFGGGGGSDNSFIDNIKESITSSLGEKVGLSSSAAGGIASSIIPAVVSAISGKIDSKEDNGFSLESVIGALSGNDKHKDGGILGAISGLFGK